MWYSESIIINTDEHHQNVLKRFRHKKLGHSFGRKVSGHNNKVVLLSSFISSLWMWIISWQLTLKSSLHKLLDKFGEKLENKSGSCEIFICFERLYRFLDQYHIETDLIYRSKFWLQYTWNKRWNVLNTRVISLKFKLLIYDGLNLALKYLNTTYICVLRAFKTIKTKLVELT